MKRLALVLPILAMLIVVACKFTPGCWLEQTATTTVTNALVKGLECQDVDAVRGDVGAICKSFGLCKEAVHDTGPIAMVLCPYISAWAVNELADATIPAKWKCNPVDAKAKAIAILTAGCNALPFMKEPK